jgi:SET domain-containing protein
MKKMEGKNKRQNEIKKLKKKKIDFLNTIIFINYNRETLHVA